MAMIVNRRLVCLVLAMWIGVGCSDGGQTVGADIVPLDPDVALVSVGSWYRPAVATTWQWQLSGEIDVTYNVDLYDVDLFEVPDSTIVVLQASGKKVICYFSGGSSEDWRPDYSRFTGTDKGKKMSGWAGERWLDIRSPNVLDIMHDRLDLAVKKGCDGVEPDNMDGFTNSTGFPLTADDQLAYNRMIANAAHQRGLSVGLKNDGGQAAELVDWFDFSLNEECHKFEECDELQPFIGAGKPVFNAEYSSSGSKADALAEAICPKARAANLRTLILPLGLDDSFRISCDDE